MSIFPWAALPDEELLQWRIKDLGVTIEGTDLVDRIGELYAELAAREFVFFPKCYLGDEWFCPDGVPIIAIPFYLAHQRLKQLEQKLILEIEGGSRNECLRLLRHECGHAINYAYRLHRRKRWRELFGDFHREYPDTYRPQPYSRRYVRHLKNWYAQLHPDEDFAETFAVWLDPDCNWQERYRGWKAMEKLLYVDELMREIARHPPKVAGGPKLSEARRLTQRLSTYYARRRRAFAEEMPDFYDRDLRQIFTPHEEAPDAPAASSFLRHHRAHLVRSVARWSGERRFTINRLLAKLTARCAELKLRRAREKADALVRVTAFLTGMAMTYLFTGKLKRYP